MWILAYFINAGNPATGLSPTVKIRDVETGVVVINGASMEEKGDGFYGYDFSAYNSQKDYAIICDSVTLSGAERYSYASSGEYNEALDTIESTVGTVDARTVLLQKIQTNKLELADGDTDNWILYDDDATTPLLTFSVTDKNDGVIVQHSNIPSKRSGASGLPSGVLSPDIYMRKSVYDSDDDGRVNSAENVSDGIYTSTASGVKYAVDNSHLTCILGTKCIDESLIGDQLAVKYDAATDGLIYGAVSGATDHGSLTGLTDDDHPQYVNNTEMTTISGDIISYVDGITHNATQLQGKALPVPGAGDDNYYLRYDHSGNQFTMVSGMGGGALVDRGDPSAYDWQLGDLTTNGTWQDLDCSSIVPSGVTAIILQVAITDDAVNSAFQVRKNGNSNSYNAPAVLTQTAGSTIYAQFTVFCDSSRVIEYFASNLAWVSINITISGWFT